jgi:AcrR family transcriptional regulator
MDEKAARILDAARQRFERFGVKKTTMDEICQDVGISKKTLYEYFNSKEDLFISTFIQEALKNRKLVIKHMQGAKDPLEQLQKLFRFAVNHQWNQSFMIRVLQDEDGLYHLFLKDKYRLQVEEGVLSLIEGVLKAGMEQGKFRAMNTRTTAYYLFKLFQSVTFAKTESIQGSNEDLEELIDFITAGVLKN